MAKKMNTQECYLAYRLDHGVKASIKLTAEYKNITEDEVREQLGFKR